MYPVPITSEFDHKTNAIAGAMITYCVLLPQIFSVILSRHTDVIVAIIHLKKKINQGLMHCLVR